MSCRCEEMAQLKEKIDDLALVLDESERFYGYNDKSIEQLQTAKTNAYTATKSTCVQSDASIMPEMTEDMEDAHTTVVKSIETALKAMEEKYQEYKSEDKAAHENEDNPAYGQ